MSYFYLIFTMFGILKCETHTSMLIHMIT